MKANKLPKSDSYDSSHHRQSAGSQAKQTHTSQSFNPSANDYYPFSSQQDNKVATNRSINAASNDADYLSDSLTKSPDTSNKAGDISCGYKKATVKDVKESKLPEKRLAEEMNSASALAETDNKAFENELLNNEYTQLNQPQNSPQQDSRQKNSSLKNNSLKNNYKQNNMTITNPVSERVFMTGLLKHTGIALAIIIPLAAFSAYAATPTTPTMNATATSKASTATININPDAIIHKSASEPTTVDSVDLEKYAGTWHEIGRLPMYFQRNCASDVTANYTEKTDGSGIIVTNKCLDKEGSQIVAAGLAKPADTTGSKLKVTFLPSWIRWLPVGRADYWVLARDADYQTALVGTPDKKYLWLLARSPNVTQQTYAKYRQIAQGQGYDLKEFTLTPHANQTVKLIP